MVSVFIHGAELADTLLISAAEDLHYLIVTSTDVFLEGAEGVNQLVFYKGEGFIVRPEVLLAVGNQTLQTRLDSCQLSPSAGITGHVSRPSIGGTGRSSRGSSRLPGVLQCEGLPALRTSVGVFTILHSTVAFNTVHAVAVATWDCHWIPQLIQTDRAELLLVLRTSCLRHFTRKHSLHV